MRTSETDSDYVPSHSSSSSTSVSTSKSTCTSKSTSQASSTSDANQQNSIVFVISEVDQGQSHGQGKVKRRLQNFAVTKNKKNKNSGATTDDKKDSDNCETKDNPEAKYYSKVEKKYYKSLPCKQREEVNKIERTIADINNGNTDNMVIPRRFKFLSLPLDDNTKAMVIQKLDYLDRMSPSDNEYIKLSTWMDGVSKIPFGINKQLPINSKSDKKDICKLLKQTKEQLDTRVYGHHDVKDHIIRILAQWISNPSGKGIVIGINGAAGVGKTTLVKDGICNSLGMPFVFIPLGAAADRSEFIGHSYTYEGARWGKIVDSLIKTQYMNPVFFFDELDKVSGTKHGEEIIHILMQITDPSQNDKFHDTYFSDFSFDLSRCIIIFSYNDENAIHPILRDRMIRIETKGYTLKDKICIAKEHLIPFILKEFLLTPEHIEFSDSILTFLTEFVEPEQGVRNLKRAIYDIISNIHLSILLGDNETEKKIMVTIDHVKKFVHKKKFDNISINMMYC